MRRPPEPRSGAHRRRSSQSEAARRRGQGRAAKSSERAAQPTLDRAEHRMHRLCRRRWALPLAVDVPPPTQVST